MTNLIFNLLMPILYAFIAIRIVYSVFPSPNIVKTLAIRHLSNSNIIK